MKSLKDYLAARNRDNWAMIVSHLEANGIETLANNVNSFNTERILRDH
jgi:hypothetical protein